MKKIIMISSVCFLTAVTQAAVVVTTEKYANTTPTDGATWDKFTTIANLSSTDYADASQGNATISIPTANALQAGVNPSIALDGAGQANDNEVAGSMFFDAAAPNRFLIDLGSEVEVSSFSAFAWHSESRQDISITLYRSSTLLNADETITDGAGLVDEGWAGIQTVSTDYWGTDATAGQVGVQFTDTSGTLFTGRYLLVDVEPAGGSAFMTEFDVQVIPEPSSILLFGMGSLLALAGSSYRRRARR
jgi:hypothetical protein